jgi:hypothetical protein
MQQPVLAGRDRSDPLSSTTVAMDKPIAAS